MTKATVSKVEVVGMGDRVCVDLCSIMRPGEGLLVCVISHLFTVEEHIKKTTLLISYSYCTRLVKSIHMDVTMDAIFFQVGSYARGMFLVHSECLETNYIASRPFRVNAVRYQSFRVQ